MEKIVELSQRQQPNRQLTILTVRSPTQNRYEFWQDNTFIILV